VGLTLLVYLKLLKLREIIHSPEISEMSQIWWHVAIIAALSTVRQEDHEFKASQGYIMSQNKTKNQTKIFSEVVRKHSRPSNLFPSSHDGNI
jgi:hypothetical protein